MNASDDLKPVCEPSSLAIDQNQLTDSTDEKSEVMEQTGIVEDVAINPLQELAEEFVFNCPFSGCDIYATLKVQQYTTLLIVFMFNHINGDTK